MIDLVKLKLKAGDGGYGRVSFWREKYVPKGGPDGGNGGNGGHIIVRGSAALSTLKHFAGVKEIAATAGVPGGKRRMFGGQGEDVILEVPLGTVVWLLAENQASAMRRQRFGVERLLSKNDIELEKFELPREGAGIPPKAEDEVTPIEIQQPKTPAGAMETDSIEAEDDAEDDSEAADLANADMEQLVAADGHKNIDIKDIPKIKLLEITTDGQEVVLCQGGFGGRGNEAFKGPDRTTPLVAEYSSFGEQKVVMLELKLLAEVGLVGFPNAGKSTLLTRLTKATPKIANYPFTTLEPHLGVLKQTAENGLPKDLVIADIPGLIAGAKEGKGLGYDFLRHVENCRALLFLLSLDEHVIFDDELTIEDKALIIESQFETLQDELAGYGENLTTKPFVIGLSKSDIYSDELIAAVTSCFAGRGLSVTPFSAATGQGLPQLFTQLSRLV